MPLRTDTGRTGGRASRVSSVTPELHAAVLRRDGSCFLARLSPLHVCHDQWGGTHDSGDLDKLTVDHVHMDGAHMGKRAPSDLQHLVAMCHEMNIQGPSKAVREAERAYLNDLYGAREAA